MDSKIKWGSALCAVVLCVGIYIDNRQIPPLDVRQLDSLTYDSIMRNAKGNDVAAQYVLGQYYLYGNTKREITKDQGKAREWFKKAADNKHAPSAFEYARLTAPSNSKEAQQYYSLAMASGFTPAIFAQSQLKLHEATPQSIKEGLELLAYAAGPAKDPLAQAYLAVLQYEGAGIKQNRVEAILNMQNAVSNAPTPDTKTDWDAKQRAWLTSLTQKEQEDLNEHLMMGSINNTDMFASKKADVAPNIAELLANLPVNNAKSTGK